MEMGWQHNNPPNPADAADGPAAYDGHLYYSYGVRPHRVSHSGPRLWFMVPDDLFTAGGR